MDFDLLRTQISKVNKAFYDGVYQDSWLALVFQGVAQEHIEMQQTDFMLGAYGGPKKYSGRSPVHAHPHIYITEEMWQLREKYLQLAFVKTNFPEVLRSKWIKIDEAFKDVIIKKSISDCEKRFKMDEIIDVPNPVSTKSW